MAAPLYQSYWVGMTPTICGSGPSLTATSALQVQRATNLTIGTRPFDSVIESCYWYITADTGKWQNGAQIYIYLD